MTTTLHHCDRCARRIDADRSLLLVEAGPLMAHRGEVELCGPCGEALTTWLAAPKLCHPPKAG